MQLLGSYPSLRSVRRRQIWCAGVGLVIVAGIPRGALGQESFVLRLTPPVGQVSHYQYQAEIWLQIPGLPAMDSATPSMRTTFNVTQTVARADSEARELRLTYDSVRLEAPMMGAMAQPMVQQAEQNIRGMVVTTRVDARGHVLATVMTGGSGETGPFSSATGGRLLQLPILPEGPIVVGATWTDSQSVTVPVGGQEMRTAAHVTYRLERIDHQVGDLYAVIRGTGTFTSEGAGTSVNASGSVASEVVLDLTVGRLVRATSSTDVTTDMPQTRQRIPMRVTASGTLLSSSEGTR